MPSKSAKLKYRVMRKAKASKERQGTGSPTKNNDTDTQCDAILVTQSELGGDDAMKQRAHDALYEELENGLSIDRTTDTIIVGNGRGLRLATRLQTLEQRTDRIPLLADRVSSLEAKNQSLEAKNNSLEVKNNSLEATLEAKSNSLEVSIRGLTISLDKLLRNRFISCFKRDRFQQATDFDWTIITAGNERAHGGDALTDAQLYMGPNSRQDPHVFAELYGMDPSIVHKIAHNHTLNALNTHAEVIASNRKKGSDKFYALFKIFVKLFVASEYNDRYLGGSPTNVTSAYNAFMGCIKDEVKWIDNANPSC